MEKEFIPYEQALALKKLGYNEKDFGAYPISDKFYFGFMGIINSDCKSGSITAPLYQQAFRWFREEYNLDCMVDKNTKDEYFGNKRYHKLSKEYETITKGYKTYEEAELELLKKLIEIVKNK